jgi:hypothetical protein
MGIFWTSSFKAQYRESWLLLLAVFRCSFATAIVKTSRIPRLTHAWLLSRCIISDISQRFSLTA